jgi:hypothetical protein
MPPMLETVRERLRIRRRSHLGKQRRTSLKHYLAIGRALRPFPRSKRSMRLSPHCAFQLGPGTREEQTHGYPWRGAPVGRTYRHLLSSLHLLAPFFLDLPWRAFTLSCPLQTGVWLLRRLGSLSRVLACSHPLRVKRLQSSLIPMQDVVVPRSCLLYAGWSREAVLARIQSSGSAAPRRMPFNPLVTARTRLL